MERLTEKFKDGRNILRKGISDVFHVGFGRFFEGEAIDRLAEYEDLEEQGKLLKLPCAVGDTVYAYCSEFGILEYEVDNIVIGRDITYQCSSYSEPVGDCLSECLDEIEPDISDFGKTVFLTREEAEAALKELEDNKT